MWPRRGLRVATSPAFRGRSIGRADGPDRASRGRFTKNSFKFSEINPRSRRPLRFFYKKTSRIISKSTLSPDRMGTGLFAKKTSHRFLRKHHQIFLKSKYSPTLIISFFSLKKYVWPVDRAHRRAKKTSSLKKHGGTQVYRSPRPHTWVDPHHDLTGTDG